MIERTAGIPDRWDEEVDLGVVGSGGGTKVTRAESLAEMAAKLGIDGDQLERTVAQFNEYAREGVDQDFHRGEDGWGVAWGDPNNKPNPSLGTLEKAPFFAPEITSGHSPPGVVCASMPEQTCSQPRPAPQSRDCMQVFIRRGRSGAVGAVRC